jgi:hypothetical protein
MAPLFSAPFPDMDGLVAAAERLGGFPAPLGAIPFVFANADAAAAFQAAVQSQYPNYVASAVRTEGPRFLVDITHR